MPSQLDGNVIGYQYAIAQNGELLDNYASGQAWTELDQDGLPMEELGKDGLPMKDEDGLPIYVGEEMTTETRPAENDRSLDDGPFIDFDKKSLVTGTVKRLQQDSMVLNDLVAKGELTIVGAKYSIETGEVTYQE